MKFHGVTMTGPFVNQKLTSLPVFDAARDQGRLVWLAEGTLWYGTDTEWASFASGAGDANEVEDMYSDLLRTTIFMNAAYDEFADDPVDDDLVDSTTMTHNRKEKFYTFVLGQTITSTNLFDVESGIDYVDYVLPSIDYRASGISTIEVSSDGGAHWFEASNNKIIRIPTEYTGTDLRMRFTGGGAGELYSWGILFNKDLTASCTKYGLTYANFEANEGQTLFEVFYTSGSVQVYLNGDLLNTDDYVATDGETVVFNSPLHAGDIVYVMSFSTSILDDAGGGGSGTGGGFDFWKYTAADLQLEHGDRYFVNTSSAVITLTAPANPWKDMNFVVSDYAGTFDTNVCIIDGNGKNIMGYNEPLEIDVEWATAKFTFIDDNQGWKIITIES